MRREAEVKQFLTSDKHYRCNGCKEVFPRKYTAVDHIIPVVGIEGIRSWDEYMTRLFCPVDNLQVLCKDCHKAKSNTESKERRKNAKKKVLDMQRRKRVKRK